MNLGQRIQRYGLRVHQALYERTDGRIGHRLTGAPSLLLRTTGRRSGERRTVALIYALDGSDYLLVASNHGGDDDPAWLWNIRADPSVEVQVGRRRQPATARVALPDDPSYARWWATVNRGNHNRYNGYQARTSRPIPLVAVTPDG